MLATGDRPRLQLRGLAHRAQLAFARFVLRAQVYEELRAAVRLLILAAVLGSFFAVAVAVKFLTPNPKKLQVRCLALSQAFCRAMVRFLNIHCDLQGPEINGRSGGILFLPNHISYLDVIVIGAFFPTVFVTSREIEETKVLGALTRAAGCTFVERRHKWGVHRDICQLSATLNAGFNVTLFPEGSTSPGDRLMEFKRSLLESAIRSRCCVMPLCLKYERIDGQPYDATNRDQVAWYGTMTFFPHLWRLMHTRSIDVQLTTLGEVAFRGHKSRKLIARDVRARIAARFYAS